MNMRILIVCMGNICRSPIAEGLLRHKLELAGLSRRISVDSAGTGPWHVDMPPDPRAIEVCRENGIAIEHLRGRQIRREDFSAFDWIMCADRDNLRQLHALTQRVVWPRVVLMLAWAGMGKKAEVPDPYTGTLADFRRVYALLDKATDAMLAKLQQTA